MKVGIISDTHGLLRPEVFAAFEGVEHILHAGDVGPADILVELEAIAPVTAVWGNTDGWELRGRVPEVATLELAGVRVTIVHGMQVGSPTPAKVAAAYPGAGLVVFGHSHRPVVERVGATLAVNPGSAGPRRFRDPVTVALAELSSEGTSARVMELEV
ncbi:MAG TPA: metallophosphoesterase family protein [Longimicrobiaceae bacterium]|nr:metallophosphoesterase family protein [Longimicrobiaceae bacterium]